MATPVHSTAHAAQIPALDSPHAGDKQKPKEKKGKPASTSTYPLEVRLIFQFLANGY